MEMDPTNPIIKICLQSMSLEEKGDAAGAKNLFLQAWQEASNDFEKYLAAFFLARHQDNISDTLQWLQAALDLARKINNHSVSGAFPSLHARIANGYRELGNQEQADKHAALAISSAQTNVDPGPFYHGTKAQLPSGALLLPGRPSNYQAGLTMNHIYFTALLNGAGLAAALAQGDGPERVYLVEPTGDFEHDPNVTDKKFPGNPTRSYRTGSPLKVIGEIHEWQQQTPEQIQQWRNKLANAKGKIIN